MKPAPFLLALCGIATTTATIPSTPLPITARTAPVESDWSALCSAGPNSSSSTILLGNDGGAATGGLRAWSLAGAATTTTAPPEPEGASETRPHQARRHGLRRRRDNKRRARARPRRDHCAARLVLPALRPLDPRTRGRTPSGPRAGRLVRAMHLEKPGERGDFLLRVRRRQNEAVGGFEMVEIQTFEAPVEASSCAVSLAAQTVFFAGDDSRTIYAFPAVETPETPEIRVWGEAAGDVTGLAAYCGQTSDYLLVAQKDVIGIYDTTSMNLLGSMTLTGEKDIEVQGLSVSQQDTAAYGAGIVAFAIESEVGASFAVSSLETAFKSLGLELNTSYDPRKKPSTPQSPVCQECHHSGFCVATTTEGNDGPAKPSCSCFAGFVGNTCESFTCRQSCSDHGTCTGANQCQCETGWGGLSCAFRLVQAVAETDANGGDGDDPAIWVHPVDRAQSRILTTTKSEAGAGLGVFALNGTLVDFIAAAQPNNVDVIYGFPAGERTVDLAYAACRTNNTLCMYEITAEGTLKEIAGGIQPTKENYEVYGSCVYRSRKTGKQYLFVNSKTAEYLQFELAWVDDALHTTLVRNFTGGTGGQVEGCVSDEANGWVLIGEEPLGLWRYAAEPEDDTADAFQISKVGDGRTYGDVEGVTLVEGPTSSQGFILVSQQGVSAYNVYRRAAPHEFVETFTITENVEKGVDAVSNTDGIAAVGTALGAEFPYGLVVVHDDANELPEGGTSDETSFKLVSLKDVLGDDLLRDVDVDWDPRRQ
ncbi:hypothetical protein PG991_000080 [Apiospora marii]|uniref:3-phytase n=1 Tax=Apiospora marii TaxID=335849 RepID=A0ABR1T141_9PEZI